MAQLCNERGIAAATIPPRTLSARGLGAHTQQLSQSSGYYRYQPGTFLRMGLVKELFIRQVLLAGFDAMVSDVDVVWLQPPWPLVRYSSAGPPVEPEAALLALADVILSVDQVCSTPGTRTQRSDNARAQSGHASDVARGVCDANSSFGAQHTPGLTPRALSGRSWLIRG
jgi:hypothetical protein